MNQPGPADSAPSSQKYRPLKERLWNWFGFFCYLTIAVGAVYHLILPYI